MQDFAYLLGKRSKNAPSGNRTQGKCLEGIYVTTTPMVLLLGWELSSTIMMYELRHNFKLKLYHHSCVPIIVLARILSTNFFFILENRRLFDTKRKKCEQPKHTEAPHSPHCTTQTDTLFNSYSYSSTS